MNYSPRTWNSKNLWICSGLIGLGFTFGSLYEHTHTWPVYIGGIVICAVASSFAQYRFKDHDGPLF